MSRRELVACVLVLALGIALLPPIGGTVLWTHSLWLDELCCTLFPTEAASPAAVVANLAHRQDLAPPLLHFIVWTVRQIAGGMTPVMLRSISLACVSLALVFTYAALRRRFDRTSSACGAIAIASNPMVLTHAFEGRFYGPWLFVAAGYAWAAGRRDRLGAVLQAAFAIGVVTIHWFGILSLGMMVAAIVASHGRRWRDAIRAVAPSIAGLVVFIAFLPLMSRQREGLEPFLWIAPFDVRQLGGMIQLFFLPAVPTLAAGLLIVDALRHDRPGPRAVVTRIADALKEPSVAALTVLAAFPLMLVVVSVLAQPSMLGRYGITTALGLAPLVALGVEPLGRAARVVAVVVALMPLKPNVKASIDERQSWTNRVQADSIGYERVRKLGMPVAWPWIHAIYPVIGPHRADPGPARFLDVPDSAVNLLYPGDRIAWLRQRIRIEANMARSHLLIYGFPEVVTAADLDTVTRFAVMTSDLRIRGGSQAEIWARIVFPHHRVVRINDQVSFFERR